MMRPLFAASAALLFGFGTESVQAQCGCARAAAGARSPSVGIRYALPAHVHVAAEPVAPVGETKPAVKAEKEVTLTGTMVCAKCGLKEPGVKKCTNALQVKDGDKTVTYFLEDKGNGEDYHEGLCGGGVKEGAKITGTVSEKEGRKWIKVTKVEEKK